MKNNKLLQQLITNNIIILSKTNKCPGSELYILEMEI